MFYSIFGLERIRFLFLVSLISLFFGIERNGTKSKTQRIKKPSSVDEGRNRKNPPPIWTEDDFIRGTTSVCRFLTESGLCGYGRRSELEPTIPFALYNGGNPGQPYWKRRIDLRALFRRRLFARIRGAFRLPCTTRQLSGGSIRHGCADPLLLRSHSLYIIYYLQYSQRARRCQAAKRKKNVRAGFSRKNGNKLVNECGEKFTKCSLHSGGAGCIIGAIYWMDYAPLHPSRRNAVFRREAIRFGTWFNE